MAIGDRIFWGVVTFIFVCLLWLKYLERFLSIWVGAVAGVLGLMTVFTLTRPRGKTPPQRVRKSELGSRRYEKGG
ncbi:MAG: hypothetical protein AB1700_15440 [Bacillota bacterium]